MFILFRQGLLAQAGCLLWPTCSCQRVPSNPLRAFREVVPLCWAQGSPRDRGPTSAASAAVADAPESASAEARDGGGTSETGMTV